MTDPRFRLDPNTIERGRTHVAEIRARLKAASPERAEHDTAAADRTPPSGHASTTDDQWSIDRMTLEMASSAERDRLTERVAALETEVSQLRSALAAVLAAAAQGLNVDD